MSTAVHIKKLGADNNPDGGVINFEQYEIGDTIIPLYQKNILKRAQNGKPRLFILSDDYRSIIISVRIHGDSTQGKLTTIRNHAGKEYGFRVYPKYLETPSYYIDCKILPDILINSILSGEDCADDIIQLQFNKYIY